MKTVSRIARSAGLATRAAAAIGLFATLLLMPAHAQNAADDVAAFYHGKQIKLVVGSAAGSGYDINARLLAQYLSAHIPGKPNIIVQNQPGAASMKMVSALYNAAPRDGTVMGAAINGAPTGPLLTPSAAHFDPIKLLWIGSTNRDTQVSYMWHTAPVKKLSDLLTTQVLVGATNPGTTQVDYPKVAREILGLKYKIVSGYKGTTDIHLAMQRGEVQGMGSNGWLSLKVLHSDWVKDKQVNIIAMFNEHSDDPELKGVPSVFSVAKTEADKQALRLMVARLEYGRPFFFPPGVPDARVKAVRQAFDETMKDLAFLDGAKKLNIDIDPISGRQVEDIIKQVLATPKDVVDRVAKALAKND